MSEFLINLVAQQKESLYPQGKIFREKKKAALLPDCVPVKTPLIFLTTRGAKEE